MLRRGYLSSTEFNTYMVLNSVTQMLDGRRTIDNKRHEEFWKEMTKKGMMTSEMQKNLKLAYTYLNKFLNQMYEELDKPTQTKIDKHAETFDFKLVDDYTLKKIMGNLAKHMETITLSRAEFEDVIEDVAELNCVGCEKDYKACKLYKVLDDCLLNQGEGTGKCPYSCDLTKMSRRERKRYAELVSRCKAKNVYLKKENVAI